MQGKVESEDKRVKQIIIGCECGCEQAINIVRYTDISIDYDVEEDKETLKHSYDYYITMSAGLFYEKQRGIFSTISKRLKAAWYILRGKEYLMCDVNIKQAEINKLIKALEDIKNEE